MLRKQAAVGCLGSAQDKPERLTPEARGEQRLQVACQRIADHLQEVCCSLLTPGVLPCTGQAKAGISVLLLNIVYEPRGASTALSSSAAVKPYLAPWTPLCPKLLLQEQVFMLICCRCR